MPIPPPSSSDFLTVEEAARVLRIGRTAAYALARTWRETDGREGLPVVEFGRLLRVPRAALEAISGGPITMPTPASAPASALVDGPIEVRADRGTTSHRAHRRPRRRPRPASPDQTILPFD